MNTVTDIVENYNGCKCNGGGGGGDPYDYVDIKFAHVRIISNTPPEEGEAISSIIASTYLDNDQNTYFFGVPQQLNELVIPFYDGDSSKVILYANQNMYYAYLDDCVCTGGVEVSGGNLYVSGDGTISIVWDYN